MTGYPNLSAPLVTAAQYWPERPAFRCKGDVLSYGELWERACAIAGQLHTHGVQPGDRVGIAMTKGVEMPVAIHAIWLIGGVFVPLDPTAPPARLAGIMADCGIAVILSTARNTNLSDSLTALHPAIVVGVDEAHPVPADFAAHEIQPDDLAYIIFTSGSTGTPKGICHTHRSGLGFAETWVSQYGLHADDVFFNTVPLHFDFSLADFLCPPMVGCVTELVPEPVLMFPASLAALLDQSRGTIWSSVPYSFIQLAERGAPDTHDMTRLHWLIYGGEPMPPTSLPLLRATFPNAVISNSYGPAETNQTSEYTVPVDHPTDRPIPIGLPSPHAQFLEQDDELLIAAPSLMRGYWNRPDLNAAVFVDIDGTRYYRTGDRVRLGDDGLWTFAGREDRQIKIRGNRIELDEVEMALAAHPDVSEAAAIAAADKQTLRAFVTLTPGATATEADILSHLRGLLPGYAVPDTLTIRSQFTKTSTGKINRRSLLEDAT